jgi:hypothetical protein
MNELERQIRNLSLREPLNSMDERVFSLLQSSVTHAAQENLRGDEASSGMKESRAAKTSMANGTSQTRRGIFSATFVGLSIALLVGIALGNIMPSLWSDSRRSTADNTSSSDADNAFVSENQSGAESPTRHPMMPDAQANVRDQLGIQPSVGSQFVESSYESSITGALLWQRQNGEVFNVSTHVSDRRFDMCRDCHRVGG